MPKALRLSVAFTAIALPLMLAFQNCGNISLNKNSSSLETTPQTITVDTPDITTPVVVTPPQNKVTCENCVVTEVATCEGQQPEDEGSTSCTGFYFNNPSKVPPNMVNYKTYWVLRDDVTSFKIGKKSGAKQEQNLTFFSGNSYFLLSYSSKPEDPLKLINSYKVSPYIEKPIDEKNCIFFVYTADQNVNSRGCISDLYNSNVDDDNIYMNVRPVHANDAQGTRYLIEASLAPTNVLCTKMHPVLNKPACEFSASW